MGDYPIDVINTFDSAIREMSEDLHCSVDVSHELNVMRSLNVYNVGARERLNDVIRYTLVFNIRINNPDTVKCTHSLLRNIEVLAHRSVSDVELISGPLKEGYTNIVMSYTTSVLGVVEDLLGTEFKKSVSFNDGHYVY